MQWWSWTLATVAALLVAAMVAMRFDTLKDLRTQTTRSALIKVAPLTILIPIAFVAALLTPWWFGLIVVAVPGLVLLTQAAAS